MEQILKNQQAAIAMDVATLISRGDSLVYDKHRDHPLLADYIQANYLDKLRTAWSAVMSEIDSKRAAALAAEQHAHELNTIMQQLALPEWSQLEGPSDLERVERDVERAQTLARELRALRVTVDDRALQQITQRYQQYRDKLESPLSPSSEALVTKIAAARTIVNNTRTQLLYTPPLSGRDYDDFPLQEDALARVKASLDEASVVASECAAEATKAGSIPQRLHTRLVEELAILTQDYNRRYDKWVVCREQWRRLYESLEGGGDALQHALDAARQHKRDADAQLASVRGAVESARACGRVVLGACGAPLSTQIQEQLDALNARWHQAQHYTLKAKISQQEDENWVSSATGQLQHVRALLATSANPSERTSLAIRLSLVKAREEEVGRLIETGDPHHERLLRQLKEAKSELAAHASLVSGKLVALGKYCARLHAAHEWATHARDTLARAHNQRDRDALANEVSQRAAEVHEVLENYNNMERECTSARLSVAPELRDHVLRLRREWPPLKHLAGTRDSVERTRDSVERIRETGEKTRDSVERTHDSNERVRDSIERALDSSDRTRDSIERRRDSVERRRDSTERTRVSVEKTPESVERSQETTELQRRGSSDSTPSDWSSRSSSRRRSSQQSSAALIANFDTAAQQVLYIFLV
ncbi:unnamed protein product [Diatraea saccharalis]|uniref:Uncharacterized protein n=1 Tax=Diatraea saccharalis TaxID=40085 RepID=A0A9N9WFT5_9NEOP|nr:unnamed protein product [Diatraea saccharalis]